MRPTVYYHFSKIRATTSTNNIIQRRPRAADWKLARETVTIPKIGSFPPCKSLGPEEIRPVLPLQKELVFLESAICRLIMACIVLEHTATVWTTAKVIFIPKPRMPDYKTAKAFWPIFLTSFVLKKKNFRINSRSQNLKQLSNLKTHACATVCISERKISKLSYTA